MKVVNRRAVLRGVGGAAIALPFLEAMTPLRPARAQQGGSAITKVGLNGQPKRYIFIYTCVGQGVDWFKNTSKPDGTIDVLGPVMAPMGRHQKDLILLDGINNQVGAHDSLESGHDNMANIGAQMPRVNKQAGGISIDQEIAKNIAGDTKYASLQLSIDQIQNADNHLSWSAAATPMPPIVDPQKAFAKLFTDFKTDPLVFERAKAERRSILDSVKRQYDRVVPRVSGGDRIKIQTHLDALRELEKRISDKAVMSRGDVCAAPKLAAGAPGPESYITHGQANMELTRMAFACDLTRVVTLNWNRNYANMPWIGVPHMHDASHGPDGPRNKISTWHTEYFAKFFDDLKAVQEGPGTLFDNTLIYWTTEVGCYNHDPMRCPVLLAGSAGGYLRTGQRQDLKFDFASWPSKGPSITNVFVSMLNAMGVPATTFGQAKFCTGPHPGLTA